MNLQHSFEIEAPIDVVWEALIDVERVAPCLPGAEVTESDEAGVFKGNFTVKLGPTTASYRGRLEMVEEDAEAHRSTMKASGQDKRGQGSAKATIVSVLTEAGGKTTVATDTDFTITGKLARFGRGGMIEDVSHKLLRDFSSCLAQTVESEQAESAAAQGDPPEADAVGASDGPDGSGGSATTNGGGAGTPAAAPPPRPRPAPAPAKPISGLSLMFGVLWRRLGRGFGRGSKPRA